MEAILGYIVSSGHLMYSVRPNLNKQANPKRVLGRSACSYGGEGHAPSAMTDRVTLSNLRGGTATALRKFMYVGHELSFTGRKQSKGEASEFG